MRVSVKTFNGIAPAISPKRMGNEIATVARNVVLDSGTLEPVLASENVSTVTSSLRKSIHLLNGYWLQFNEDDVSVEKSPLANSIDDTFYYTGVDYPRISWASIAYTAPPYPANSYRLGVPAPDTAPLITATNGAFDDQDLALDVAWVYTFVTADGREGPPSPASIVQYGVSDNQTFDLSLPAITPAGNHNFGAGAVRRVYRSNTGSSATAFQFVGEVPIGTTTFSDTKLASELREQLPSIDWSGPPDDDSSTYPEGPLKDLCHMGNGIMAGFSGNTLWFSEAYIPHAFPVQYTIPVTANILRIVPAQAGLYVLTDEEPLLITGRDPASLAEVRLEVRQSCVSRDSVVAMENAVVYASPDGLVALDGMEGAVLTEATHLRKDWAAYVPSSIKGFWSEERYVGFYDTGSVQAGFIFDPRAGRNAFTELDDYYSVGFSDLTTDTLYVLDDTNIQTWDTGSALTLTWRSKTFDFPEPTSLSCGEVDADGVVTLKVFADGQQLGTDIMITSRDGFRLPAPQSLYQTFQFELSSTATIHGAVFANSFEELEPE